jgi:hypothetical protein
MKKNTLLKTLFALIFVFLFIAVAGTHALELQYPEVKTINGNLTINEDTTPTGYVVYVFYFLVALAGIIAFMVVVWGGFNLFMAGGEPGKVQEAKNKILGAFVGLLVLFSIYIILGTINKNILEVKVEAFNCNDPQLQLPICVETKKIVDTKVNPPKTKVFTEMSIPNANENLVLAQGESIVIKKYQGLQEIWGFEQTGFQGSPIKVYPNANTPTPLPATGTDIQLSPTVDGINLKSYKIIDNTEGIWLYDQPNSGVLDGTIAPYFLNTNVPDFAKTNPQFVKKTQSAKTIDPRHDASSGLGIYPSAIFFSEPQYRGYCAMYSDPSNKTTQAPNVTDLNALSQINDDSKKFGYNLSSAIYFKMNIASALSKKISGRVVFYNSLNCKIDPETPDSTPGEISADVYEGGTRSGTFAIALTKDLFPVKSIKIDGPVGVILMERDKCQFFSSNNFTLGPLGNCIASISESSVTHANNYMLISLN